MALSKQAKILTNKQADSVLRYLPTTRDPIRNRLIFLLSFKAGLRAKEIAALTWPMVTDAEGNLSDEMSLTNKASKGKASGRTIPIHYELRAALAEWREAQLRSHLFNDTNAPVHVVSTQRSRTTSAQTVVDFFRNVYSACNLTGCSSHSGRRTFITNAARKISTVGGSLRDVQQLAGHSSLQVTQRYIDQNKDAQRRVVDLM